MAETRKPLRPNSRSRISFSLPTFNTNHSKVHDRAPSLNRSWSSSRTIRADNDRMTDHDIAAFLALLASGVVGALITTPVRIAITVAAKRTSSDRRR